MPAPATLQQRRGNRGTARLLSQAVEETRAVVAPVPERTVLPRPAPAAGVVGSLGQVAVTEVALATTPGEAAVSAVREAATATTPGEAAVSAVREAATATVPVEEVGPVPPETPGRTGSGSVAGGPSAEAPAAPDTAPPPPAPATGTAEGGPAAPAAAAPAPAPAEAPPAPSPEEAIAPTVHAVARRARQQRAHSPAGVRVANASASARQPAVETQRSSAERTVEAIDAVPLGEVPKQSFKDALRRAIDEATPKPKTEDEAERVMAHGATDASAQLNSQLGVQREQAAGPLRSAAQAEAAPAPEAGAPAPALVPEPTGPAPEPVSAGPVVPAPLPAERLDYSADRGPTDQAMTEAGVSTDQLQRGNEPEFTAALEARSTAESHEAAAGPQYRADEAAMRGEARAQAEAGLAGGLSGMHAQRLDLIGQVVAEQDATKTGQSQERRLVTERVIAIREAARQDVEVILTAMDANAVAIFEVGLREAEAAYESAFEEAKGGLGNWLTEWGSDWDRLIERSLATGRAAYLERVGRAIDQVAALVEGQLAAAKQRVAAGRAELDAYVAGLDEGLKSAGEEARQKVGADFDALDASIDDRRDRLVERLTQQYGESYQRMSETENRLREENKSLWQRVYDATVGVIQKILEFKNMLLSVLAEAASVVMLIISDPIQFLKNLIGAVMQGVMNFKDHIVAHLEKGLLDWIFGAVAGAGIQLPAKFDLPGILGLILQVLGLTWANIRRIAVEIVGEPIVHALEMFAEPVIVLIREGPAGLWTWIKEKLSDLKAMLLDEIQSWLVTNVVEAGIKWILGLLTPVGAFIKACKAIYDIVMFFVERAKQVADLVKAVTESVGAIARGSLGAAAQRVEDALARSIPVAIGLLASLLGLDNLSATIAKFIQRIRKPVEQAIRWLIGKAVELVKAAGRLLGIGKDDKKNDATKDPRELARRAIDKELEAGLPEKSADERIAAIATELKPLGLTGLELRGPDAKGEYEVFAAASPFERLMSLLPESKLGEDSVRMQVELTLEGPVDLSRTKGILPYSSHREDAAATGPGRGGGSAGGPVYRLDPPTQQITQPRGYRGAREDEKLLSGGFVEAGPAENTLRILTFNTADSPHPKSYRTHAEYQLLAFLKESNLAARVTGIEVTSSKTPCTLCTLVLSEIGIRTPKAKGKRSLKCESWYVNKERGTTPASLSEVAQYWKVDAGEFQAEASENRVVIAVPPKRRRET